MRFAVFVRANKETEAGVLPSAELLAKMGQFNDELVKAGVMLAGEGLQASSKGARLHFSDGNATVTDGPFAETKELVAGFWIVQGKSKEEIVERFKHAPMLDGDVLEIRRIFEAEDFGENVLS
ncbi:MAG TPA: YciI family protein [Candidatus Baltobacteraceae bacterium]|nr:YciI family protein [Candidatus Baltobacteraceae bacterium]